MFDRFKEIYQFRELLINLTIKELKLRYKNSAIGFFWSFLSPLMMLIIYSFAFKLVMKIRVPNFPIFILSGLLPWVFMQSGIVMSSMSIVGNANLIKKVYFPREIIPLSVVLSNFINFLITLIVLFLGIIFFKIGFGLSIVALPLMLLILFAFVTGMGLILSAYTVSYRDLTHFIEILLQGWFYITPIVYPFRLIPEAYRKYLVWNPMTPIIEGFHNILLDHKFPAIQPLLISSGIALFLLIVGFVVFRKREIYFAEEA